jgi:hypothetical protein
MLFYKVHAVEFRLLPEVEKLLAGNVKQLQEICLNEDLLLNI